MTRKLWKGGVLWLGLLLGSGVQATGNGVTMNFSGTLVENKCELADNGALEVVMVPMAVGEFSRSPRSPVKTFTIGLKNCQPTMVGKVVKMRFGAQSGVIQTEGAQTYLTTSGGTGLLIGLTMADGSALNLDTDVIPGTLLNTGTGSENWYTFGAYAFAPAGVTVKAGAYEATATLSVDYQ